MSDELREFLIRADASAPAPAINTQDLPNRIRRTARNQHRLAACGLALLALAIPSLFLIFSTQHSSETPMVSNIATAPPTATEIDLHERTAALLQLSEIRRPKSH